MEEMTPLMWAAAVGNAATDRLEDEGKSPRDLAAAKGDEALAALLGG